MISHDRAQELISARMDAPLTPAEHRELHAHLAMCDSCRFFVASADDLARGLHVLPRLAPSPVVSRAVMSAISTEQSGWNWLRNALQALSSPGMAVASGLALVLALAGAMIVALNAPNPDNGIGTIAEGTIPAIADAPLPTRVPTETPEPAQPTATATQPRTITDSGSESSAGEPARTPTPKPTATRAPQPLIVAQTEQPAIESGSDESGSDASAVQQPQIEPVDEAPELAMAPEAAVPADTTTDLAQAAEPAQTGDGSGEMAAAPEAVAEGEVAPETEAVPESNDGGRRGDGGRNDDGQATTDDSAAAAEPVSTEAVPVPDEAMAALENAGESSDIILPPAPALPMPPDQAFLPITPTPVSDGTPTPDPEAPANAPQLAEDWSGELGVTALAPDTADVAITEPDLTVADDEQITAKEKKDRSAKDGKSHENQQRAYGESAMGWSMAPVDLLQSAPQPQTSDPAVSTVTPTDSAGSSSADTATTEPAPQYDPATGLEIDPGTGLLIDPATGYLLDLTTGLVYHPGTGFQVHPMTGLLIDPVTGAQLDPVTLAVVIPPGFGSDQPAYTPGDEAMRGQIETVVDTTYDDATYKVIPATDGPVQPVDEIVVPTESGESVEIE